ncbi:phospholipase A1 [Shewanella halifaxensis HAW-EB4]|uniref:Phospholipase A1 n=1 Tax=Shewanella halifaxensis (strain HAW-EB4) TaxID=458817 RepID=B0TT04_SHEHH|nr:phospholipase A [Shewanella halifaxensis]ABZ76565.1 phospholipase A1 [Shewanella halifaxensis HAW-EB4]
MKHKTNIILLASLVVAGPLQAKEQSTISKDITGVAGLTPLEDLYKLTTFDNNFILPVYQTQAANQSYYAPQNPNKEEISNTNLQFQFSLKYGIANNLFTDNDGFYIAYSQISNWQAYDKSAYFRDSQYQPQVFWFWQHSDESDTWQSTSVGFEHQSNGKGGVYERSWNRVYLEFSLAFSDLEVSIKPWLRTDFSSTDYNPDIEDYMGYGSVKGDWYFGEHQVSLTLRNLVESGFSKGYEELSWRFPIYKGLRGYLKLQSGYGLTISDYNHFDNAVGIGIAL